MGQHTSLTSQHRCPQGSSPALAPEVSPVGLRAIPLPCDSIQVTRIQEQVFQAAGQFLAHLTLSGQLPEATLSLSTGCFHAPLSGWGLLPPLLDYLKDVVDMGKRAGDAGKGSQNHWVNPSLASCLGVSKHRMLKII